VSALSEDGALVSEDAAMCRAIGSPVLRVEDVWFAYSGQATSDGDGGASGPAGGDKAGAARGPALQGVSLTVSGGERVAIVGRNGSGKTTLARHLNGLLRPQRGRVLVNGLDTAAYDVGRLAAEVGYVFQNPDHQLFSRNVGEEIAFGPRNLELPEAEVRQRVAQALATLGWSHLPSGRRRRWDLRSGGWWRSRRRWRCDLQRWCWTSRLPGWGGPAWCR
jgi:energy-coupling factor transporter ATP-binding protein EcfA2